MSAPQMLITSEPTLLDVQYLEDRISEFNAGVTGITDGELLAIFLKDESGRIIAGICGNTWGGCLEIRQFWVDEALRRQGVGTKLLDAAELEARRRGCQRVLLMTFSFQAPSFYVEHGFEIVAAVQDHPNGHRNLLMLKQLGIAS